MDTALDLFAFFGKGFIVSIFIGFVIFFALISSKADNDNDKK